MRIIDRALWAITATLTLLVTTEAALAYSYHQTRTYHNHYPISQRIELALNLPIGEVLPPPPEPVKRTYSKHDLMWLTIALYHEDRWASSSDIEIAQVGYAILNRVKHQRLGGKSIHAVLAKADQYPWYNPKGGYTFDDERAKKRAAKIAKMVLEGTIANLIGRADHFLAKNVNRAWTKAMDHKGYIGKHKYFYSRGV